MRVSRIKKESLFFCLSMREELQKKANLLSFCVFQKRREDTCKKEGLFCGDYDDDGKRGGGGGGEDQEKEEEEESEAMGDVLERGVDDGRGVLRRGLLR